MYRTVGIILAGVFVAVRRRRRRAHSGDRGRELSARPRRAVSATQAAAASSGPAAAQDVAAVLARRARRAAADLCVRRAGGRGRRVGMVRRAVVAGRIGDDDRIRDFGREKFGASDVRLLMDSLSSTDPCVRELSVRLLGRQRDEHDRVRARRAPRFPHTGAREVAALGLGSVEPKSAVDPLMRALRDATPGVRANSAWALGRIRGWPCAAPAHGSLARRGGAGARGGERLRWGAWIRSSAVEALIRVVREDASAQVRRSAAWALGQLEARSAVDVLIAVLRQDADARVREMAAWAIGSMDTRTAAPGLIGALRRDSSDAVRETAAWALGNVGDRTAADILGDAVQERQERARTWHGGVGVRPARPEGGPAGLIEGLTDQDDDVRLKSAWALGQIGDSTAVTAIRRRCAPRRAIGRGRRRFARCCGRAAGRRRF